MDPGIIAALLVWSTLILWWTGWFTHLGSVLPIRSCNLGILWGALSFSYLYPAIPITTHWLLHPSYIVYFILTVILLRKSIVGRRFYLANGVLLLGTIPLGELFLLGERVGIGDEWVHFVVSGSMLLGGILMSRNPGGQMFLLLGSWLIWNLWRWFWMQDRWIPVTLGDGQFRLGAVLILILSCLWFFWTQRSSRRSSSIWE